jgi:hypothetical protein
VTPSRSSGSTSGDIRPQSAESDAGRRSQ